MYGTIMRGKVKAGRKEELERFLGGDAAPAAGTGFVGVQVGWEDKDPDRLVVVVVFKDKEAYQRNSEREDTVTNYRRMLEYVDGEIEWLDVNWGQYIGAEG